MIGACSSACGREIPLDFRGEVNAVATMKLPFSGRTPDLRFRSLPRGPRCKAEIQRLLDERGEGHESTVVMTTNDKEDPDEWLAYDRDRAEEARVKARFRDFEDPLKFLIVTAKLLTGFDAPIEGVMYLDKPLRKHTLFQALTRTNRRWTNPETEVRSRSAAGMHTTFRARSPRCGPGSPRIERSVIACSPRSWPHS